MTVSKPRTRNPEQSAARDAGTLERRARQLEFVHAAAGVVSWVWDAADDRVEWFGDRDALFGLPPGAFSGRYADYLAHVHPDDAAAARRVFTDCLKGRQPSYRAEHRVVFPERSIHWLETFGRAEYGPGGRAVRMGGMVRDVTERKAAEAALRSSEGRFVRGFQASPHPQSITRVRDACFVAVNAAFERSSGYAAHEVIGRSARDLGLFADEPERVALFAQLQRDGSARDARVRLRRRDGTVRIVEFSIEPIEIDGEPHRLSQSRDVTEAVMSSQLLQESLRKFSAVFETSPEPIAVTRARDGVHLEVNGAWVRTVGLARSEAVGRSALEIGMWADAAERARLIAELELRGRVSNFATRFRRADGATIDVLLSCDKIELEGERCLVHVWRDVTEQRQAERAIAVSEQRYRGLFEAALDSIVILDAAGRLIDANPACTRETGFAREELIGRSILELFVPEDVAANPLRMGELAEKGVLLRIERRVRHKNGGAIPVEINAWRLPDGNLQAIVRNVTERKLAEARILELNASLEQRVRERTEELQFANRELESFSYSISHDLRAPVRAIAGFSSILATEHGAALNEDARRCLHLVDRNAKRMGELIEDLLEFARAGRGTIERKPVDMRQLAAGVIEDLGALDRVALTDLPAARGDASLLRQVWQNLIANAIKFSRDAAPPRVEVGGAALADGTLEYSVRDNGCGFDMRYAGKLFNVFQRLHADREYEGTGVGLAIVQRIVARHGGRVAAESSPGKGARFSFILPA